MAFHQTRACLLAATALTASPLTFAHAQDQNVTPLGRIVLGWGTEQVALDTPQATTVVDQTDIERQQATTTGELLQGVPGVTPIGSERPAGQTFNIRGFGEVPAGDEGRVVIQQDGANKYYEQYRLGAFFADPAAFCNIEVLRGPASATLYGGGAIGGVIRFETCQASDYLEEGEDSQLRLTFGLESNAPGGNARLLYASRPSENVEFLVSGGWRTADDYEDGDGTTVSGSAFDAFNILASSTYHIDSSQRLKFTLEAWDSDLDDTALDQTDGASVFGTTDRRTQDITLTGSYEAERDFGDLEVTLSYSDTKVTQTEAENTGPGGPPPAPPLACGPGFFSVLCAVEYGYTTASIDARVNTPLNFGNQEGNLIYGATYIRQDRTGETVDFGAIEFHPEGVSDRFAVFAQSELYLSSALTVVPGLRLEYYRNRPDDSVTATTEDTDFVGVSPKIAFTYDLSERVGLFGSIAQTQRAPTIDELYSFDADEPPALDLDPETARSIEAGFTFSDNGVLNSNDAFDARATAFYSRVEDLIERDSTAATPQFRNIGEAEIFGIELEAAYQSDRYFGSLAYTYIVGNNLSDNEDWDDTPQPNLALTLGGRAPDIGLEYGWRIDAYQRLDTNGTVSPGYTVHDVFVDYRPDEGALEGTSIQFGVDNIFDKTYQNALGSSSDNGRGRSFRVTVSRVF